MNESKRILVLAGVLPVILALVGCVDYRSPTAPDTGVPPGPEGAVVTITASGVEPRTVTIAMAGR